MANFFADNDDLLWYFDKGIDWDPIVRLAEWDFRSDGPKNVSEAVDTYRDFANLIGEFVGDEIAPHWNELDHQPPKLVDGEVVFGKRMQTIFDRMRELDLHWLPIPREFGGMNSPMTMYFITAD